MGRDTADGNMEAVLARADLLRSEDAEQTEDFGVERRFSTAPPLRPGRLQGSVPTNHFSGGFD